MAPRCRAPLATSFDRCGCTDQTRRSMRPFPSLPFTCSGAVARSFRFIEYRAGPTAQGRPLAPTSATRRKPNSNEEARGEENHTPMTTRLSSSPRRKTRCCGVQATAPVTGRVADDGERRIKETRSRARLSPTNMSTLSANLQDWPGLAGRHNANYRYEKLTSYRIAQLDKHREA
ncbi:hypothetical protein F4820DRAFT_191307 [Hypoxylon rubiginosum]|uniref:Uncharacterized protein n=1 Tax=Hypoxylon rubiginosum TaxID=110542 RepID=A0ACB9Z833_9PEZI|nr:hypothetical protein F4820DRAFT_191307 [Hypoxylon rubiginosum]